MQILKHIFFWFIVSFGIRVIIPNMQYTSRGPALGISIIVLIIYAIYILVLMFKGKDGGD